MQQASEAQSLLRDMIMSGGAQAEDGARKGKKNDEQNDLTKDLIISHFGCIFVPFPSSLFCSCCFYFVEGSVLFRLSTFLSLPSDIVEVDLVPCVFFVSFYVFCRTGSRPLSCLAYVWLPAAPSPASRLRVVNLPMYRVSRM